MKNNIRSLREYYGMSQRALGLRCGLSSSQICGIENGKQLPSVETAIKIARVLKMPVEKIWIADGEEEPGWRKK